jgi:hypothetical protein
MSSSTVLRVLAFCLEDRRVKGVGEVKGAGGVEGELVAIGLVLTGGAMLPINLLDSSARCILSIRVPNGKVLQIQMTTGP